MDHILNKIIIKTKRQVFSEILGDNSSLFKGEGYDFIELREYETGEDCKKIDWTTSAKLQKPYVKVFHETKELNIVVASMLDHGVLFGTSKQKQEIIANIVSILGFSAIKQNNPFSSYIFHQSKYHNTKPSKHIHSIINATSNILQFNPRGLEADYNTLQNTLYKQIKKRSLIFVIGDFFDDCDLRLLSIKHEVIAIIVRDKFEEDPKHIGQINLIDKSNIKSNINISSKSVKTYKQNLYENDHKLFEHFKQNKIKWCKIYTNADPIVALRGLFD